MRSVASRLAQVSETRRPDQIAEMNAMRTQRDKARCGRHSTERAR